MIKNLSIRIDPRTKQKWLTWNGYTLPWFSEEEAIALVKQNTPRTIVPEEEGDDE